MSEPFYWNRPVYMPAEMCSPDGWYQWTDRGLIYLGDSPDGPVFNSDQGEYCDPERNDEHDL